MRVDITGRHIDITPGLRQLIGKSLARVERLLNDRAVSATVVLTKEKYRHKTELVVHARQDHTLAGIGTTDAWGTALTAAVKKVLQQAETVKGKWQERKRSAASVRVPRSRKRA